jgi:pimeloyl-ACP methyl ester carboxylesterase
MACPISPADPARYSAEATIDDMAALLDAVGAERAVIGGLSLGGYMSLMFHAKYPQRVRALLILDTGPGFRKYEARNGWNQQAARTAERFEREGMAKLNALRESTTGGTHRSATGLALAARGMLAQRDATVIESLPGIRVPSLIVVGADDTPFLQSAEVMAAKIAGASKVVIPAAGHTGQHRSAAGLQRRGAGLPEDAARPDGSARVRRGSADPADARQRARPLLRLVRRVATNPCMRRR